MTLPTPIPSTTEPAVASVGFLARLKLTEPVRLYLYSVVGLVVVGLNVAGILTGNWPTFAESSAATLLALPAAEAARASVYSPRSVVQAVRRAAAEAQ